MVMTSINMLLSKFGKLGYGLDNDDEQDEFDEKDGKRRGNKILQTKTNWVHCVVLIILTHGLK